MTQLLLPSLGRREGKEEGKGKGRRKPHTYMYMFVCNQEQIRKHAPCPYPLPIPAPIFMTYLLVERGSFHPHIVLVAGEVNLVISALLLQPRPLPLLQHPINKYCKATNPSTGSTSYPTPIHRYYTSIHRYMHYRAIPFHMDEPTELITERMTRTRKRKNTYGM